MDNRPISEPADSRRESRRGQKRKSRDFDDRKEFRLIRQLDSAAVQRLDKLRSDLQECIERTVRVEAAFVKQLQKEALNSNRIKHIIHAVEEIPFHSELLREIVDKKITLILKSKEEEARIQREEAAKQREKEKKERCTCMVCLLD